MKKSITAILLVMLCISSCAFAETGDVITDFGVKWLSLESVCNTENPVFSPASAYFALSMVALGANNDTLDEIRALIGDENNAAMLMSELDGDRGKTIVSIANSAWIDEKYMLNGYYSKKLANDLNAEAHELKLASPEAIKRINAWINDKTNGMIPRTLNEPFSADTALALASTLYFNGEWLKCFSPEATREGVFIRDDKEYVKAEYMNETESYSYLKREDGAQCVLMPYTDGDTALLAILPPSGVKASEYICELNATEINGILSQANQKTIQLQIPKIEAADDFNLVDVLKELGVKDMFNPDKADLSGMLADASIPVWVSKAVHKAKLSMGEKGTEAAAVTVISMVAGSAPDFTPPPSVRFERSFIYALMDLRTGAALFMGIVNDPSRFDLTNQNVKCGWDIVDGAPELCVITNNDFGALHSGSYSLKNEKGRAIIADSVHALDFDEYAELTSTDGKLEILSSVMPTSVKARYWAVDCKGNAEKYEDGYNSVTADDFILEIDIKEEIIVEISVEWSGYSDMSGTAEYVFLLKSGK